MKEQQNRLFHRDITLKAPEYGYELLPQDEMGQRFREAVESVLVQEIDSPIDAIHETKLKRGRNGLSYPLMALMIKKNYGDVASAMQQMVVSDMSVTHGPIINKVGEEEYKCEHVPGSAGLKTNESTFDPENEETIGDQLSVGKAVNPGDSFYWSTTMY